jgi:hypothetical protein
VWQVSALDATVLAADASGEFLFAANAGANTLTRYRIDSQTGEFSSGSAQSFATGANPSGIALVNAPKPLVTGTISVSLASESLLTFASTTGQVTISAAAVNGGKAGCAGQVIQVSFSVPSIGVITVGTSTTPVTSVCVLTGKTSAAFNVTTAATSGSAVLTAFETGFTDGTTNLSVSLRTITLTLPYTNIGVGHTVTGSVTLANPAPAGGVTIALASSAVAAATVSPHTVTIAGGASTAAFTVTGVQANTATLSAKVASGGYSPGSIGITVLPPGLTINLPHNAVVAPGQSLPYPITIGAAAASAVSVTLKVSGGPGTATFAPNPVTIPAGATTPATAPTIKGVHIGPLEVTGSATGYAPDTEAATVQITLTFNPDTLNVETGKIADLVLSASAIAPVGGFTIDLKSSVPGFATVPTSIVIAAGTSTVKVPVTGVAAGATTITASAPGAITATAAVTAFAPPGITLYGPTGDQRLHGRQEWRRFDFGHARTSGSGA